MDKNNKLSINEFTKITAVLKTVYKKFKLLSEPGEVEIWYQYLQDCEYAALSNAVAEYCATNIYPPTIAELRKLCNERVNKAMLSPDKAWTVVSDCIRTYGLKDYEKAFAQMDELTKATVKKMNYGDLCRSERPDLDRANFKKLYDEEYNKRLKAELLPEDIRVEKQRLISENTPMIENKEVNTYD